MRNINYHTVEGVRNVIRLVRMGCANRPFYQIGVAPIKRRIGLPPNEVIGSYDPMPNEFNEKLVAVDLDRLAYWIGEGAVCSNGVSTLLGVVGYLPIYPKTFKQAWVNRAFRAAPPPSAESEQSSADSSS